MATIGRSKWDTETHPLFLEIQLFPLLSGQLRQRLGVIVIIA